MSNTMLLMNQIGPVKLWLVERNLFNLVVELGPMPVPTLARTYRQRYRTLERNRLLSAIYRLEVLGLVRMYLKEDSPNEFEPWISMGSLYDGEMVERLPKPVEPVEVKPKPESKSNPFDGATDDERNIMLSLQHQSPSSMHHLAKNVNSYRKTLAKARNKALVTLERRGLVRIYLEPRHDADYDRWMVELTDLGLGLPTKPRAPVSH